MEQSIIMETYTNTVKEKMFVTQKLKILTDYTAQVNPPPMDVLRPVHQIKCCAHPKKAHLVALKKKSAKIDQPMIWENIAQTLPIVLRFAHLITSIA